MSQGLGLLARVTTRPRGSWLSTIPISCENLRVLAFETTSAISAYRVVIDPRSVVVKRDKGALGGLVDSPLLRQSIDLPDYCR